MAAAPAAAAARGATGAGGEAAGGEDICRGIGGCVCRVNHIALVVQDVGDSLFFYTDIVGFKQINRVNFDRHGAWLSMGNIQLHLIKGQPHMRRGQHPADLIVSHIALEVADAGATLERLRRLQKEKFPGLRWRQNVSVPTWEASSRDHFETDHTSAEGKLTQFFLEDPDGYWLEICNCGEHEEEEHVVSSKKLSCGDGGRMRLRVWHVAKMKVRARAWIARMRSRLGRAEEAAAAEEEKRRAVALEAVDKEKLNNFRLRRNTYGDICQGFSDDELRAALAKAGNHAPSAVLCLRKKRQEQGGQVLLPPAFLDDRGKVHLTSEFRMPTAGRRTNWL
mmetsp:Transcript_78296/g.203496  ORF Transcript_78296/g.203496 Transcript_78296/m.203496 type:complete len:336 (-) Transcript_78296:44-1051(-)